MPLNGAFKISSPTLVVVLRDTGHVYAMSSVSGFCCLSSGSYTAFPKDFEEPLLSVACHCLQQLPVNEPHRELVILSVKQHAGYKT